MTILLSYKDISQYIYFVHLFIFFGGGESGDPYFFLNISSSYAKMRLHTENQLARLPGSALKVSGGAASSYMVAPLPLIWFLPIIKSTPNSG